MQFLVLGRLPVDAAQEHQPLLVAVPLLATRNERTVQRTERCEQRRGAVAVVVMSHRGSTALLQRQAWLSAIERLHLALLVAAQHQRVFGWIEIQPDDVLQLLHESRIARDLKGPDQMRFEPIAMPYAQHRCVAHAHLIRQGARAPVCRSLWQGTRGKPHDLRHIGLERATPAGQITLNRDQPTLGVALSPTPDLHPPDFKFLRDGIVVFACRRKQHNLRTTRQAYAHRPGLRQLREFSALFLVQHYRRRDSHLLPPVLRYAIETEEKSISSINYEALH